MNEHDLLRRITVNPQIFGGKPIIRGRRLAVEHVLDMLAAGDTPETILEGYPWPEPEDVRACLMFARRYVGDELIEPLVLEGADRRSCSTHASGVARLRNCAQMAMTSSGRANGTKTQEMRRSWPSLTPSGACW
jgi:uncharacterized protein (DUF433 family)